MGERNILHFETGKVNQIYAASTVHFLVVSAFVQDHDGLLKNYSCKSLLILSILYSNVTDCEKYFLTSSLSITICENEQDFGSIDVLVALSGIY